MVRGGGPMSSDGLADECFGYPGDQLLQILALW